jgi:ribonuclease Z
VTKGHHRNDVLPRKAYQADIENRRRIHTQFLSATSGRGSQRHRGLYEQNAVRVTGFRVKHANLRDAFGFRVDYRGHAVVISGDMAPSENFIKYAEGADVVIHELGVARPELLEKDAGVRRMLATHHSSPEDAARDFARIKPKLAAYTHFTRPRREDIPEVSIAEITSRTRAIYSGPLEAGEDLMSISIGDSVTVKRFGE